MGGEGEGAMSHARRVWGGRMRMSCEGSGVFSSTDYEDYYVVV